MRRVQSLAAAAGPGAALAATGAADRIRSPAPGSSTTSAEFEAAVSAAEEARSPERADSADLIAARAYLERFRESVGPDDLDARPASGCAASTRTGSNRRRAHRVSSSASAKTLFFEGASGAAADVFDSVLESPRRR